MLFLALADLHGCISQCVPEATDVHIAAVDRIARRIAQIALHAGIGIALPITQGVGKPRARRKIVGKLDLGVVLEAVIDAGCTEDDAVDTPRVLVQVVTRHHRCCPGRRRRKRSVRKRHRIPRIFQVSSAQRPAQIALPVAKEGTHARAIVGFIGAVEFERLAKGLRIGMCLELFRHPRLHDHDDAGCIARISGGMRAVTHVNALDLLRRNEPPARRIAIGVAKQHRYQDIVRIDQRAGTVEGARIA